MPALINLSELIAKFNDPNTPTNILYKVVGDIWDAAPTLDAQERQLACKWSINSLKGGDSTRIFSITDYIGNYLIGNPFQEDTTPLIDALRVPLKNKNYKVRGSATRALGRLISTNQNVINRKEIVNKIISMLDDEIFDVRRQAVIALCWYIKDPIAIKPLQRVANAAGDSRDWMLEQIQKLRNVDEPRQDLQPIEKENKPKKKWWPF